MCGGTREAFAIRCIPLGEQGVWDPGNLTRQALIEAEMNGRQAEIARLGALNIGFSLTKLCLKGSYLVT